MRSVLQRDAKMIVDALVPVKAAATAKARLAPLLSPPERRGLVCAMLEDVLEALCGSALLRRVVVTSPDAEIRALSQHLGAVGLSEPGGLGLNGGLAFGLHRLLADGADGVLIVPADLPAIRGEDVAAMLLPACSDALVRAAPSIDGGTGALLLTPPTVIAPAFGAESFARHRAAARSAGVRFERRDRPGLAADVDYPEDLLALLRACGARHARTMLLTSGITQRCSGDDRGRPIVGQPNFSRTQAGGGA